MIEEDKIKHLYLDGYELYVEYGTIKYGRDGRVSVNENLSDGLPIFHTAGLSQVVTISCNIYIPIDGTLFEYLDDKVYKNETVTIKSSFGKIFPSGKYYIENFQPEYMDGTFYQCSLELTLFNGIEVTELFSHSKVSTNNAILSDYNSVSNQTKFNDIGEGSTDSNLVKKIQQALRRNGFYLKEGTSSLLVDGIYSTYTTKAVQEFQKAKGLNITGIVNKATAEALNI